MTYDPDRHFLELMQKAEALGFSVQFLSAPTTGFAGSLIGHMEWAGQFDPNAKKIHLNPFDHFGDRNAVLAHEIAHALQFREGLYVGFFFTQSVQGPDGTTWWTDPLAWFRGEMDAIDRMAGLGCTDEQVRKNRKRNIDGYTEVLGLEHMGRS